MQEKKISILMGAFNEEKTIEDTIDCILKQTYSNWELIICDDASTDNTYHVISEIAEQYPNKIIAIRNTENKKLAFTLNHCFQYATGEFIGRMDAVDICTDNRFEKQVGFLNSNPKYSLVGTNMLRFDYKGVWGSTQVPEAPQKKDYLFNTPYMHPTILIRRSAFQEVGGYMVAEYTQRCEDYDLWLRLLAKNHYGYNIQEYLYTYFEDRLNSNKFSYKYRIDEAKVRYINFKKLGWMPGAIIYVIKPLIIGLIPSKIYMKIFSKRNSL